MATEPLELTHRAHALDHLEIDDEGWMHGSGIGTSKSVRDQALGTGETHVLGIVWHYTDTRSVGAVDMAKRIAGPVNGGRAASWHLIIDRQGYAVQSVSCLRGSWHAGGPSAARFQWQGKLVEGHRRWIIQPAASRQFPGANSLFFGIELENVGEVRLVDGKWLGWPFKFGTQWGAPVVVPDGEVDTGVDDDEDAPTRGHHIYTSDQVDTATRVTAALAHKYGLIRDNCAWTHQQIDPNNRTDPGPLWVAELPSILDRAFVI